MFVQARDDATWRVVTVDVDLVEWYLLSIVMAKCGGGWIEEFSFGSNLRRQNPFFTGWIPRLVVIYCDRMHHLYLFITNSRLIFIYGARIHLHGLDSHLVVICGGRIPHLYLFTKYSSLPSIYGVRIPFSQVIFSFGSNLQRRDPSLTYIFWRTFIVY